MPRFLISSITALALLAACDGTNPFFDEAAPENADPNEENIYGRDLNASLTANYVIFRQNGAGTADDTILVNNIPFDNSDREGGGYTQTGTTLGDFDVYESPAAVGDRQYYAVFQRTTYSQVAAIGTNDYIGFGFGGLTAQRVGSGATPPGRPAYYTFTGQYAGVRILRDASGNGAGDLGYVQGTATLTVDISDFDTVGAVEGIIDGRSFYDGDGNFLYNLDDYVSLATGEIDFDTDSILKSTAVQIGSAGQVATGNWAGLFNGPSGQEIAGIVFLEGVVTPGEGGTDTVRENGVFVVLNTN